ncbi:MAG: hypothetical protein QGG62_06685, partial [Candidatus Poseidoniaceae archaeon]|nr:hypothetical protein [Candidatus Poseidoniaceae archaeon]
MPRFGVVGLLILLLLLQPISNVEILPPDEVHRTSKNSGVDLSATDVSIRYSNPSDESQYKMFSSNHPILGFDRPESLFVVDTVNSTPMDIEVTVRNNGNTPSGIITIQMLVLHNEYERFELANRSVTMNSLSANGQGTATFHNVYVNYSGNHTLVVTPSFQGVDDNPSNDALNRHYTVANFYFTCTSLVGWNAGPYWGTSTDTALSMGQSCHIGQGQSGSYANNLQTDLMTPIWDMSDIVSSPTRTNGLTFFYAGSAQQNDAMKVYAFDNQGNWDELATIAGTVGATLSNWQTISNNNMGHTTQLIPADTTTHFHSNSRFKFTFSSDSSGTDIGYWFDDFVIVYDQSARTEEYNLDVSGIFTDGSIPGSWGKVRLELTNTGNISDSLIPSVTNLPNDWNVAFSFPSGAGVNPNTGVRLLPGESRQIDVKLQPSPNASVGFVPLTFMATSIQNPSFSVQEQMQFQVSADRIPHIHIPEVKPKCAPGSSCAFYVEVENIGQATDVFDLQVAPKSMDQGWNVNLAFDQSSSIRLIPNQIQSVKFVMTVPSGETPDKTGDFWFTMIAQNDTSRTTTEAIVIQASMISNAEIDLNIDSSQLTMLSAGERVEITYTLTNLASRQDSFDLSVDFIPAIGWLVEPEQRPPIVINPGASTSFYIAVTAPNNAQANDMAPEIKPVLTSIRSGMQYEGPSYNNIMIETLYDVGIEILSAESELKPGGTTTIELEVTNYGNGPTSVSINLIDTPSSWIYSLRLDGVILELPTLDLGVSYTGSDVEQVEILLFVPMTEAGGEFHTITIGVEPEGQDLQPEDNEVEADMITGRINFPELNGSSLDYHAMVDSTVTINGTVMNVGNALESSMDVGFELSTSPPTNDVVAFMTAGIGGPTSESGEVLTFPMGPGTSKLLFIDVMIGDEVPLNTRIVVTMFVEGGLNEEGDVIRFEHQNLITVDEQRKIEMQLSEVSNNTFANREIWLNLTSLSTQTEDITYSFTYPENWQMMCDGTLIANDETVNASLPYARNKEAFKDIRCEIQRLGGVYIGDIVLTASTIDEVIQFSDTRTYEFEKPAAEEGFFSKNINGPTLIAVGIGVLILIAILFIARKQRNTPVEEEAFISGPPISQQTIVQTVPTHTTVEVVTEAATETSTPP